MSQTMSTSVSAVRKEYHRTIKLTYVAFVLGYEFLHNALDNSMMHCDEAYDYCVKLAEGFIQSKYDNECEPVYECIERFAKDKMPEIGENIRAFNVSVGGIWKK